MVKIVAVIFFSAAVACFNFSNLFITVFTSTLLRLVVPERKRFVSLTTAHQLPHQECFLKRKRVTFYKPFLREAQAAINVVSNSVELFILIRSSVTVCMYGMPCNCNIINQTLFSFKQSRQKVRKKKHFQ